MRATVCVGRLHHTGSVVASGWHARRPAASDVLGPTCHHAAGAGKILSATAVAGSRFQAAPDIREGEVDILT